MKPTPEEVFDECMEAARSGGQPEGILRQHPDLAERIRPLVGLATELEGMPKAATSGAGLFAAMGRMAAEQVGERKASKARAVIRFVRRWGARAAVILLAVLIVGWGAAVASADAEPGDFLYPLKLFTERVRFSLALNREDRAELRMVFSNRRLGEAVQKQLKGGGIDKALLTAMLEEARLALATAEQLPEEPRALLASQVSYASQHQKSVLERLKERAAPPERQVLDPYIEMCGQRCDWMRQAPRPVEDDKADTPPARRWRQWMETCPMQNDGCGCR